MVCQRDEQVNRCNSREAFLQSECKMPKDCGVHAQRGPSFPADLEGIGVHYQTVKGWLKSEQDTITGVKLVVQSLE